ncbi:MAG: radical SAM protein [Desulfamplus sp.]|nr:radical SAM protein [Desulfamplus sp.]
MIILINPPNPPGRVSNKDMMGGFGQCYPPECDVKVPPIDIPYTAAVLRDSKIETVVIDCLGSDLSSEGLIATLRGCRVDLICIRTSTPTFSWDVEVAKKIKEETDTPIVFFGPHASVVPDDVMANPYVNAIVIGEPEYTIRDISLHGFKDTPGIWFKEKGEIVKNKTRERINDLDKVPFPAWHFLPYMEYTVGDLMPDRQPTLFLQTSRGCPFSCKYCPYPVAQGATYRKRSAHNVLDEFEYIAKELNIKNIIIRDAEFSLDRQRVVDICEGLIASDYFISWRCETRVDTLDMSLIELMRRAGCIGINMGIESKSEKVCRKMGRKPLDEKHTRNIIHRCRELGMHTFCFFIIGLPGDDIRSVLDTVEYAAELNANISQFTVATPYLGTDLYRWAKKNNYIESHDISKVTGYETMMHNELLSSEQIMNFKNAAQNLLYLIQSQQIIGIGDVLKEERTFFGYMSCLYLLFFYFKGKRKVVVGIDSPVSLIRRLGFDIVAVVDDKNIGKRLNGMFVLNIEFINAIKPDVIVHSWNRIVNYIKRRFYRNQRR